MKPSKSSENCKDPDIGKVPKEMLVQLPTIQRIETIQQSAIPLYHTYVQIWQSTLKINSAKIYVTEIFMSWFNQYFRNYVSIWVKWTIIKELTGILSSTYFKLKARIHSIDVVRL